MNEEQVIKLMDEIKDKITLLSAMAGSYINLYQATIKAVEKKYGEHDAQIIKKAALMSGLDHAVNKIKERECEDD